MGFLIYISNFIIPLTVVYIVMYGFAAKIDAYKVFVRGAEKGFKTVLQIMPTLLGLMVAVGVLRASGFLDFIAEKMVYVTNIIRFPSELVPLAIVKAFSSSAATSLVLDIFKEYGTDSYIGIVTSLMMSSTETIFYTMSVYFMAAGVHKSRWTLIGCILATLAGIAASVVLATLYM